MKAHCSSEKFFSNLEHRSLKASKGNFSSVSFSLRISKSSLLISSLRISPRITRPRLGLIYSYLGKTSANLSIFSFLTYSVSSSDRMRRSSSLGFFPFYSLTNSLIYWANSILSLLFRHPITVAARHNSPSAFSSSSNFTSFYSSSTFSIGFSFYFSLPAGSIGLLPSTWFSGSAGFDSYADLSASATTSDFFSFSGTEDAFL